jgi:hypothetical protein
MSLKASITLFAWSLVLAVLVLLVVAKPLGALAQYQDTLERTVHPKHEPYGGCDEAYLYPDTPGWTWCRDRGYLD